MGPGLNPQPDIYAWEKPDIMAWGLQPNCAVLDVMSPGTRTGEGVCFGYAPVASSRSESAPAMTRSQQVSTLSCSSAYRRGVQPSLSVASTIAPASTRSRSVGNWPSVAALCRGVSPDGVHRFTSARARRRILTTSGFWLSSACLSGEKPCLLNVFGSDP